MIFIAIGVIIILLVFAWLARMASQNWFEALVTLGIICLFLGAIVTIIYGMETMRK